MDEHLFITIDNTDENSTCALGCVLILSCKNKSRASLVAAPALVKLTILTRLRSLEHLLCEKKYFPGTASGIPQGCFVAFHSKLTKLRRNRRQLLV
jgi:hypothetical protein